MKNCLYTIYNNDKHILYNNMCIAHGINTSDFVVHQSTVPEVLIHGSNGEERHRFLVLRYLQTIVHSPKSRSIVILIQHCDAHCGLGKIGRRTTISGINCL